MVVLDTSGLLAALFPDQRHHESAAEALRSREGPLVLSPFVLAELDYLVSRLAGVHAERALLRDVAAGAYRLASITAGDVALMESLIDEYSDLEIGLADASVVVLARRHGVIDLLSLDERHFRVLRGPDQEPFRLLPLDT